MSIKFGIYELPRDELGLVDIDLEGDSTPVGWNPSRLHQGYRELVRRSSVEDKMIDYVEDLIQEIIDENFPGATIGPIQPTSEITFFEGRSGLYN